MLRNIKDITNVLYINLESRTDRKKHVEEQLGNIGLSPTRFNAIKMERGALGCSQSHLHCLLKAKENNWSHIMICEDDVLFTNPKLFVDQFNKFLAKCHEWDVVLLAGNNRSAYKRIDETCVQVYDCQTATAYLVKEHYYDTLIKNFEESYENLEKNPDKYRFYALDQYWKNLQKTDKWLLVTPLTITQRADHSDIEKIFVNYGGAMLHL
ncbi:MAG: glycosyltransferase family 25 protein [Romboutsia sp.]|nr:glycosyltransferase family 25 protein [Romboutsia sp.]